MPQEPVPNDPIARPQEASRTDPVSTKLDKSGLEVWDIPGNPLDGTQVFKDQMTGVFKDRPHASRMPGPSAYPATPPSTEPQPGMPTEPGGMGILSPQDMLTADLLLDYSRGMSSATGELDQMGRNMLDSIQDPTTRVQFEKALPLILKKNAMQSTVDTVLGKRFGDVEDSEFKEAMLAPKFMGAFADYGELMFRGLEAVADPLKLGRKMLPDGTVANLEYEGSYEEFVMESAARTMAQNLLHSADSPLEPDEQKALKELYATDPELPTAMVLESFYRRMDEESKEMGFWDTAGYEFVAGAPHLLAFLAVPGQVAGLGTKAATMLGRSAPLLQKVATAYPRLAWFGGAAGKAMGAGAAVGMIEAFMPLNAEERQSVLDSGDPDQAMAALRLRRVGTMTVLWPFYELIGGVGNKLAFKMMGGNADRLIGFEPSWTRRAIAKFSGGATKGAGFAVLGSLASTVNPEQRQAMLAIMKAAGDGTLTMDQVTSYVATTLGGSVLPFALLDVLTGMRHMPGLSRPSQKMIERMTEQVIRDAPPELRKDLQLQRSSLSERMSKDLQDLMTEGGTEHLGTPEIDVLREKGALPNYTLEQIAREAELSHPKTEGEAKLREEAADGPLVDQVRKDVAAGKIKLSDWHKGSTANMVEKAYTKIFNRRLLATHRAAVELAGKGKKPSGSMGEPPNVPVVSKARPDGFVESTAREVPKGIPENLPWAMGGKASVAEGFGPEAPGQTAIEGEASPQQRALPGPKPQKALPGNRALALPFHDAFTSYDNSLPAKRPPQTGKARPQTAFSNHHAAWMAAFQTSGTWSDNSQSLSASREARLQAMNRVSEQLPSGARGVVTEWDNIVDAPEWDAGAGQIIAFFGSTIERGMQSKDFPTVDVADQVWERVNAMSAGDGMPLGSTPAVNKAQLIRRTVNLLNTSVAGRKVAKSLLDNRWTEIADAFHSEKRDTGKVRQEWGRRKMGGFDTYLPWLGNGKSSKMSPVKAARLRAQEDQIVDRISIQFMESLKEQVKTRPARAQDIVEVEGEPTQKKAEAAPAPAVPGQPNAVAAPAPKPKAKPESEKSLADPAPTPKDPAGELAEPEPEVIQAAQLVESSDPRPVEGAEIEHIQGGTLLPRMGKDKFRYGNMKLEAINLHPDLQPRKGRTAGNRWRVDQNYVNNMAAKYDAQKLHPLEFAWTTPPGSTKPSWYLIDGHHKGALAEAVGLDIVPARFHDEMSWERAKSLATSFNGTRRNLTFMEQAYAIAAQVKAGATVEQAGKSLNHSAEKAQKLHDMASLPHRILQEAQVGSFGDSEAGIISVLEALGEYRRTNPELMHEGNLERVAGEISKRKMYRQSRRSELRDFVDMFLGIAEKEAESASGRDTAGWLMPEVGQSARNVMDIVEQVGKSRASVRRKVNEIKKARKGLEKYGGEDAMTSAQAQNMAAELNIAKERLNLMETVYAEVLAGSMDIDRALEVEGVENPEEVRALLENLTGGKGLELHDEPRGNEPQLAEGAGGSGGDLPPGGEGRADGGLGSEPEQSGQNEVGAGGSVPEGEVERATREVLFTGPDGKPWPRTHRSAEELEAFMKGKDAAAKIRDFQENGQERVFPSRKAAIERALELELDTGNAQYVVVAKDPNKPYGRHSIKWFVPTAVGGQKRSIRERLKDNPEYQQLVGELLLEPEALQKAMKQVPDDALARMRDYLLNETPEALQAAMSDVKVTEKGNKVRFEAFGYNTEFPKDEYENAAKTLFQQLIDMASGGFQSLFSGLDPKVLNRALKLGRILIEEGVTSIKMWAAEMVDLFPKLKRSPYLREMWEKLRETSAGEYEINPWTAKHDKEILGIDAPKPAGKMDAPAHDSAGQPIDPPHERRTIEEQVAEVRRGEIERALRGEDAEIEVMPDPFMDLLPETTQEVLHPIANVLTSDQKPIANAFVTALTDGGRGSVLDMSGTGSGKTWTTMAVALEMQRRNGGKILLVTSTNAAIESWKLNDFKHMPGVESKRIGGLDDVANPERDILLVNKHKFSKIKGISRIDGLSEAIRKGEIKTIVWDESHHARTWFKSDQNKLASRMVKMMDLASVAGAKQIFSSATPFEGPEQMRYLQSMGLWSDFEKFLKDMGVNASKTDGGNQYSVYYPEGKAMASVYMNLVRFKEELASRGQGLGMNLSYKGVENLFSNIEPTPEQSDRYDMLHETYNFLQDAFESAGVGGIGSMAKAWRVNHGLRYIEELASDSAVEWADKWIAKTGGRFLFTSRSKEESGGVSEVELPSGEKVEAGRAEGYIIKKRDWRSGTTSIYNKISERKNPAVAQQVVELARQYDQAMGTHPATIRTLHERLKARGYNGIVITGDVAFKERGELLQQWLDPAFRDSIDYMIGTQATIGESITAKDVHGRQILHFVPSIPWTASETMQVAGRSHRLGAKTLPTIVWSVIDDFPTSRHNVAKVAARMRMARAGVQGQHSESNDYTKDKDMAAFFLGGADSSRISQQEILRQEDERLRKRKRGAKPTNESYPGVDLVGAREQMDGDVASNPARDQADAKDILEGALRDIGERTTTGSYETWQSTVKENVEKLFQESEIAQLESNAMPISLNELIEKSVAAEFIGKALSSEDVRGREGEAITFLYQQLGARLSGGGEAPSNDPGLSSKLNRNRGGGQEGSEGGFLDIKALLSVPYRAARLGGRVTRATFMPKVPYQIRPEYPPHLRLAGSKPIRELRKRFDDPQNILGWRIQEPFMEATRDFEYEVHQLALAWNDTLSQVQKAKGNEKTVNEIAPYLMRALDGQYYGRDLEDRLGRPEEYHAGAAELQPGETVEGKFAGAKRYQDAFLDGEFGPEAREWYQFMRNTFDRIKEAHVRNSWRHRQLVRQEEAAFRDAEFSNDLLGKSTDPAEQKELLSRHLAARKRFDLARTQRESYTKDWGLVDYFPHIFEDKHGDIQLDSASKSIMPKEIQSAFTNKSRVTWDSGWLEDPRRVFFSYMPAMLRKIHYDRALASVESLIEGDWVPVNTRNLKPKKESPTGMEYDENGKSINEMPFDKQEKAKRARPSAREVRYEGEVYDATMNATKGDAIGLELLQKSTGKEVFIPNSQLGSVYLEAKDGGLVQQGSKNESRDYFDNWLSRLLGHKEYANYEALLDNGFTIPFYKLMLGFGNMSTAQLNFGAGMFVNLARLGPLGVADGARLALSPGQGGKDVRRALRESGMLTRSEMMFTFNAVRNFKNKEMKTGAAHVLELGMGGMKRVIHGVDLAHMAPFLGTEAAVKAVAFSAGFAGAQRRGATYEASKLDGMRAVGMTQHWYEGPATPMITWGGGGRALMQFSNYGLKFYNALRQDVYHSIRGFRDSMRTGDARPHDVESMGTLVRGGFLGYLFMQAMMAGTQAALQWMFDDETAPPLDPSFALGTRLRDIPGGADWWLPAARGIERATGYDVKDTWLPGVLAPFGASPPLKAIGALFNGAIDAAAGDPKAGDRLGTELGRLIIPANIKKFLLVQDLGGEGSDLDQQVEGIQDYIRNKAVGGLIGKWSPEMVLTKPGDRFYNAAEPYMYTEHNGDVKYRTTAARSSARFFLFGSDPITQAHMDLREEQFLDADIRKSERAMVREAYMDWRHDVERLGNSDELTERLQELGEKAKEWGVPFTSKERRQWNKDFKSEGNPTGNALRARATDKVQAWEFFMQQAEIGMTPAEFSETYRSLRGDSSMREWVNQDPGNIQRLQDAIKGLSNTAKDKSGEEK
jgi:hypothetical protein